MLGLLALAGLGLGQKYFQNQLNERVTGLLGTPESARAGDEGPVQIPGSGLMADPANPIEQMKFAKGLLELPGGARALQGFAPMLSQAIQSKQWQQGQAQQADQFGRTEARLTDQFGRQEAQQGREFDAMAAYRQQQQANWKAEFEQRAAQAAQSRALEGARLQLARQQDAREAAAAAAGPKPPSGYGVVDTASGRSLMPMPGTENFAKAKEGEGTLVDAIGTIDSLMNDYLGKEVETRGGNVVRRGGMGSELWGPGYTQMNAKRGTIIANLGKAREMGVLDKGEYERLTKQLPEVDELFRGDKSFAKAYEGVRDEFSRALVRHRAANPWLVPPPPPGFK